jgi:hypothetical protein
MASYGFTASGSIYPSRFVALVSSEPFIVEQSTASKRHIGISQKGTQEAPGTSADTGLAAATTKTLRVHLEGEEALLKLGGTVNSGDYLTADASGQGVSADPASTAKVYIGARAMQDGGSGEFIRVVVKTFEAVLA